MFTSGYQESNKSSIEITDCSKQAFKAFLTWCYTDQLNINMNAIQKDISAEKGDDEPSSLLPEILVLADQYGAFCLFRKVESKLLENVDFNNITSLLSFAETYNANFLSEFCVSFLSKEYDRVLQNEGEEAVVQQVGEGIWKKVKERREFEKSASVEERRKREIEARGKIYEIERESTMERFKQTKEGEGLLMLTKEINGLKFS